MLHLIPCLSYNYEQDLRVSFIFIYKDKMDNYSTSDVMLLDLEK
jgi:hypothetical protein